MADRKGTKFPVSLLVAARPDTGETFILYTDRELQEQADVQMADLEQSLEARRAGGEKPEAQEKLRQSVKAEIDARLARERRDREAAMPCAERVEYTLIKPTWGEHLRALGAANVLNEETGEVRFDQNVYAREIVPGAVDGMSESDVLDMDPVVADELRGRLLRAISPSRARLPFTSSPSSPS